MGYHHGDLHATLLREATTLLREHGIEGLSLRRLAERAGVSRTAPYHHFKDKNALLCALAAEGFSQLDDLISNATLEGDGLSRFVRSYIAFACENPEQYDLMFGRTIWKSGQANEELKQIAYASFRHYAERTMGLFQHASLASADPLRLSQASWATLHGLCRLLIDGIYVNREDMEAVSEQAVLLMRAAVTTGMDSRLRGNDQEKEETAKEQAK